jgi:transposase InsO family protein
MGYIKHGKAKNDTPTGCRCLRNANWNLLWGKKFGNTHYVKNVLREIMARKGTPEYLRSDNGSEFIAKHLREWLSEMDVAPVYITPGSPWENGFVESFNGTMANELLNREIFDTLYEAKVLLARLVEGVQYDPATQCAGVSAAGTGSLFMGRIKKALKYRKHSAFPHISTRWILLLLLQNQWLSSTRMRHSNRGHVRECTILSDKIVTIDLILPFLII